MVTACLMGLAKAEHFIDSMDERPRRMISLRIGRQVHLKKNILENFFIRKLDCKYIFSPQTNLLRA